MEVRLGQITKTNNFKLCKECRKINWYENEECRGCGERTFLELGVGIMKWYLEELKFWVETEHYTEEEADDVDIEV